MMDKKISLSEMKLPCELSKLSISECEELCKDIRRTIIKTVLKNGGHLSSNLGTVELTVAMHRVFNSPSDKFVWDVGHQIYTHKLLTGRYDDFGTLRKENGISGFCRPDESEHDAFISGHSSNSISAALGISEAMKLRGDNHHTVAVIGDGAFTGGLAYEGLNNAGKSDNNLIVILNHNDMSISRNVGAFAKYLTSIRGNTTYIDVKKRVEHILVNTPFVGKPVKNIISASKTALKSVLYHSTMFEDMGFIYLGPVDGHNLEELEEALKSAKKLKRPVFVHVNTVKGKGYKPAELNPGAFHAVPSTGYNKNNPDNSVTNSFSEFFGKSLCSLADNDDRICAITAAMKYGTGLQHFAAKHYERFYDVGIAEQHAVTFAAGLAKERQIPVFAVYSSFLQRSYDQLVHDVAIDNTHIVLAIDRAGFVGEDGETHQGLLDVPMLATIPNTVIYSPSTYAELEMCLKDAIYKDDGVVAIRYPKGIETVSVYADDTASFSIIKNNSKKLAVSYGRIVHNLYNVENCDILKLVRIFPIDSEVLAVCMEYDEIFFFEESSKSGGIGEKLMNMLYSNGYKGSFVITAAEGFVKQCTVDRCLEMFGLDSVNMQKIINMGECVAGEN